MQERTEEEVSLLEREIKALQSTWKNDLDVLTGKMNLFNTKSADFLLLKKEMSYKKDIYDCLLEKIDKENIFSSNVIAPILQCDEYDETEEEYSEEEISDGEE